MPKIKIYKEHRVFNFFGKPPNRQRYSGFRCKGCLCGLSASYVYIIKSLDEAGLLLPHYHMLCCVCYEMERLNNARNHN